MFCICLWSKLWYTAGEFSCFRIFYTIPTFHICIRSFGFDHGFSSSVNHRLAREFQVLVDIRGCDRRSGRLGQSEATMAGASSRKLASTRSREEEDIGERLLHTESFRSWKDLEEMKTLWTASWESRHWVMSRGHLASLAEQTQPQADWAFSQSNQPYVVTGMI